MLETGAWGFTIGSAFFEGKFLRGKVGKTMDSEATDAVEEDHLEKIREQINTVCEYMVETNSQDEK